MFRFTIRDVLWLTVVVAFAVLWQMEIRLKIPPDVRSENIRLKQELDRAQANANGASALIRKLRREMESQGQ